MDKHYFIRLLRKYLKGEATEAEQRVVIDYYDLFRNEPDILDLLAPEDREKLKSLLRNRIWKSIEKHEQSQHKLRPMIHWQRGVAAAAVLALFVIPLFFLNKGPVETQEVSSLVNNQQKENQFIQLDDGSKIMLSPGSKLDYPASFEGVKKREVYLEGQAFFDIRKDAARPFVVHTGKLETLVLGTAFNVNAFESDDNITVTVTRGRVQVSNGGKVLGIITPDEQLVYDKHKARVVQNAVDPNIYIHWKDEDVFFDNLPVTAAAKFLEEKFNVQISIIDETIGAKYFTATFTSKQTLDQALKSICEFNGAVYEYDKNKAAVVINAKKE